MRKGTLLPGLDAFNRMRLPSFLSATAAAVSPQPAPPPSVTPPPPAFTIDLWTTPLGSVLDQLTTHVPTPAPKPAPTPKPAPKPPGASEPETRVIKEQAYSQNKDSAAQKELRAESKRQSKRANVAPGTMVGRGGGQRIRAIRDASAAEKAIGGKPIKKTKEGWQGPELRNPNDPQGRFDPYAFQPRIVFDAKEDSFPVRPDYDQSGKVGNDLERYEHGVVGGKQPLEGAFTVTQRGEYTVQTYSLNYVDNKFTNYHEGDSSTISVYLKKNKQGKLEPAYLYTSWHYAGTMTAWKDLKKDAQGRPVVRVERGSHALHPYGAKEKLPKDGLQVGGDGLASLKGKDLPNRMTWLTLQDNVANAKHLDPEKKANQPVWNRYLSAYPERTNPFHPVLFKR